jgi:hypothetical protein
MSAKRSKPRKTVSVSGTSFAKLKEPKKMTRPKAEDESEFETVTMTKAEAEELKGWLQQEIKDPNFKRVDPVKLNHAILTFMVQVTQVMKLKRSDVEKFTQVTRQHQRKLRPHVTATQDVQVALANLIKWEVGLHLNPAHVLERVMKQLTAFWFMLLPVGG